MTGAFMPTVLIPLFIASLSLALAGCNSDALPSVALDSDAGSALRDGQGDRRDAIVDGGSDVSVDMAGFSTDLFGTCSMPRALCGMLCTDLTRDPTNCGGCGNACGPREVCLNEACGPCPLKPLLMATAYATGEKSPSAVAIGDLDADGKPDIAASSAVDRNASLNVGWNQGNGTFAGWNRAISAGPSIVSFALGDVFGSGVPDVIGAGSSTNAITLLQNQGKRQLDTYNTYYPGLDPYAVIAADLDNDGRVDVVSANAGSNDITVLLDSANNVLRVFQKFASGASPHALTVGDWNGDGKPDLAVANSGDNNVSVFIGRGDGTFAAAVHDPAGKNPVSIAFGDLDGDGKADLAVANHDDNTVSVLLNQGNGTFAAAKNFPAGNAPVGVAIADFDGDGKNDLAVADTTGGVAILLNQGGGAFAAPMQFDAGGNASSLAAGDLNGDGKPDLAVTLPNNNAVAVLLNHHGECQ